MALKANIQGLLIYAAMVACLVAFVGYFRGRRIAIGAHALGFGLAVAAFLYRGFVAGHVPLQSMFEIFLCLGVLSFPVAVFCRRFLRVGGEGADAVLGFIVLFPAGFVFSADTRRLPPALQSWLFAPHVGAYMLAYMIMAKAAVHAGRCLADRNRPGEAELVDHEEATSRLIRLGFPLLTLGLVLGAWWGKLAWGNYWNWDPKELWSLATWLVYLVYLHARPMLRRTRPKLNAALALGGFVAVILTLLWVNLGARIFGGLHTYT